MNTIIPQSVTTIGERAFYYCSGLTSITIPNGVTSIGHAAFIDCSSLNSITIPNSVTSIGGWAFYDCTELISINIPTSVTSIGDFAFGDCSSLASIIIPNSITNIEASTFKDCTGLTYIVIPNSVTSIERSVFYNCSSLTDYYVWAETVPSTNSYSFYNTNIENATLHVPAASVDTYKQTDPWSGFGRIVPLTDEDPTSMKGILQSDHLNGDYYDLKGRKVNIPKKGLYINNGRKVIMK